TEKPPADLVITSAGQTVFSDHRFTLVGRDDYLFIIRYDTEKIDRKDLRDIVDGHHIPSLYHVHAQTVDDQFIFPDPAGFKKSDDPVCVADCRYFRRCHYDGTVSAGDGVL